MTLNSTSDPLFHNMEAGNKYPDSISNPVNSKHEYYEYPDVVVYNDAKLIAASDSVPGNANVGVNFVSTDGNHVDNHNMDFCSTSDDFTSDATMSATLNTSARTNGTRNTIVVSVVIAFLSGATTWFFVDLGLGQGHLPSKLTSMLEDREKEMGLVKKDKEQCDTDFNLLKQKVVKCNIKEEDWENCDFITTITEYRNGPSYTLWDNSYSNGSLRVQLNGCKNQLAECTAKLDAKSIELADMTEIKDAQVLLLSAITNERDAKNTELITMTNERDANEALLNLAMNTDSDRNTQNAIDNRNDDDDDEKSDSELEKANLNAEIDRLKNEVAKLKEQVAAEVLKRQGQHQNENEEAAEAESDGQHQNANGQDERLDADEEVQTEDAILVELEGQAEVIREQVRQLETELFIANEDLAQLKEQLKASNEKLKESKGRGKSKECKEEVNKLKKQKKTTDGEIKTKNKNIKALNTKIKALNRDINALNKKIEARKKKINGKASTKNGPSAPKAKGKSKAKAKPKGISKSAEIAKKATEIITKFEDFVTEQNQTKLDSLTLNNSDSTGTVTSKTSKKRRGPFVDLESTADRANEKLTKIQNDAAANRPTTANTVTSS